MWIGVRRRRRRRTKPPSLRCSNWTQRKTTSRRTRHRFWWWRALPICVHPSSISPICCAKTIRWWSAVTWSARDKITVKDRNKWRKSPVGFDFTGQRPFILFLTICPFRTELVPFCRPPELGKWNQTFYYLVTRANGAVLKSTNTLLPFSRFI
mgnify:CR=1 FL=1